MAISNQPSASEINVELGRAPNAPFSIDGAEERALAQVPTGPISFADFIGKSAVTAILDATMVAGQESLAPQFVGYDDGTTGGGVNAYGSITPNETDTNLFIARLSRISGNESQVAFRPSGSAPDADSTWERIEIRGITDTGFSLDIFRSDRTSTVIAGLSRFWIYSSTQWAFVDGDSYNVKVFNTP